MIRACCAALALFVLYSLGFDRVLSLIDRADVAVRDAYDHAAQNLDTQRNDRIRRATRR